MDRLVEIRLPKPENFLLVKETLTRMGVVALREKKLYQSCHILHKQGRYAILHFKELFQLDGKQSDMSEEDVARRNTIARLLDQWGLVEIVDPKRCEEPVLLPGQLRILKFEEKKDYELVSYRIGKKSESSGSPVAVGEECSGS
jgi:hypothetical protein